MSGDQDGNIFLWDIKSKGDQYKLIMHTKNMFTLKDARPTTSCDYFYENQANGVSYTTILHVFIGDEGGIIRIFDLSELIKKLNLEPIKAQLASERIKQAYKINDVNGEVFFIALIFYTIGRNTTS